MISCERPAARANLDIEKASLSRRKTTLVMSILISRMGKLYRNVASVATEYRRRSLDGKITIKNYFLL
jgi:hypothetical protein